MAVRREEWDEHVSYEQKLAQTNGPVVLINHFSIDPAVAERFLTLWRENAALMKRQPGYISAQLHRSVAGSGAFVNVAVWQSTAALAAAVLSPEFQALNARFPEGIVARP